jgi:hypothetical protein
VSGLSCSRLALACPKPSVMDRGLPNANRTGSSKYLVVFETRKKDASRAVLGVMETPIQNICQKMDRETSNFFKTRISAVGHNVFAIPWRKSFARPQISRRSGYSYPTTFLALRQQHNMPRCPRGQKSGRRGFLHPAPAATDVAVLPCSVMVRIPAQGSIAIR